MGPEKGGSIKWIRFLLKRTVDLWWVFMEWVSLMAGSFRKPVAFPTLQVDLKNASSLIWYCNTDRIFKWVSAQTHFSRLPLEISGTAHYDGGIPKCVTAARIILLAHFCLPAPFPGPPRCWTFCRAAWLITRQHVCRQNHISALTNEDLCGWRLTICTVDSRSGMACQVFFFFKLNMTLILWLLLFSLSWLV